MGLALSILFWVISIHYSKRYNVYMDATIINNNMINLYILGALLAIAFLLLALVIKRDYNENKEDK